MKKKEREQLRQAFVLIWKNEDGGFEDGMRILAKLAGIKVPLFDALDDCTETITVEELAQRENTPKREKE